MYIYARRLSKNRTAVMLRESTRVDGNVKTRIVTYFGIAHNNEELLQLKKKAYAEKRKLSSKTIPKEKVEIRSLSEKRRINEGFADVFGKVFDQLGLRKDFTKIRYQQLRNVVMARIANPVSKRQTSRILARDYQVQLSEDQIYRLMDQLIEKEKEIKQKVFEATKKLSPEETVNVLFFDVTTLYFESQKNDELKDFGYSKDGKKGEVQVVLALATTEHGLPIGYNLFPGNTAETKTLLQSLDNWKSQLSIQTVRIIADRAMMSNNNLSTLEETNNFYIIAAKLKSLSKEQKKKILEEKQVAFSKGTESTFTYEFKYSGRRLIVNYNSERALKDIADRVRLVEKIKSKIGEKKNKTRKLITNNGYLKFTKSTKEGEVEFDEHKILEEALWDGLHGIITNDFTTAAQDLLAQYKRLWIIEESFRINKHSLSMRPIYHYRPKRIESHILICYLAFSLCRQMQMLLKQNNYEMSIDKLREELSLVEASLLEDRATKKIYRVPSETSDEIQEIYRILNIKRSNQSVL
jgi:transposase